MNVIDILVTIVVVTILVTIILAVVTYVAYKLRLSREPSSLEPAGDGLRYFVQYSPPGADDEHMTAVEEHELETSAPRRPTRSTPRRRRTPQLIDIHATASHAWLHQTK